MTLYFISSSHLYFSMSREDVYDVRIVSESALTGVLSSEFENVFVEGNESNHLSHVL